MQFSRREAIGIGAITALGLGSAVTAKASTAYDIDTGVGATLDRFYRRGPWARGFVQRTAACWSSRPSSKPDLASAGNMAKAASSYAAGQPNITTRFRRLSASSSGRSRGPSSSCS